MTPPIDDRATFVFDIDGTLCFEGRPMDPRLARALADLQAAHRLVFASARHPINIPDVVPKDLLADATILGANGAIGREAGRMRFAERLPPGVAAAVCRVLEAHRCPYLAYGADFVHLGPDPHPRRQAVAADIGPELRLADARDLGDVVKILALPGRGDGQPAHALAGRGDVAVHIHRDGSFDVCALGTDKRLGLERLGIALPVFAAFGNDLNDLGMLAAARHAVAVGDCPEACALATTVVPLGERTIEVLCAQVARLGEAALRASPPVRTQPQNQYGTP